MSQQFNSAKSTSYLFTIGNRRDLSFKLQNSSIGSVNLGSAVFGTRYADLNLPHNKLEYGPMSLRVLISETLVEWFALYKWMIEIAKTSDAHLTMGDDAVLTILNSENQPTMVFTYKSVYPLNIGDILYSIVDEEQTQSVELSISYDSFDVENLITGEKLSYAAD